MVHRLHYTHEHWIKYIIMRYLLEAVTTASLFFCLTSGFYIDYEKQGAIPDDDSFETALKNGKILNQTLVGLESGDVFYIANKTFHLVGGIIADSLENIVIQIDGTLSFTSDRETWPKNGEGHVLECIYLTNVVNMTLTSSGIGTLDGNGQEWWGAIQFLKHQEVSNSVCTN